MELVGPTREVVDALTRWLADPVPPGDPDPLVVSTSGSTGRPKRVVLSRAAVQASVAASARRLGATGPWLLALPVAYVAGAQVVCRSVAAGHPPLLLDDHASFVDAVAELVRRSPGGDRFTSLVPTQLHRMLADPDEVWALRTFHTVLVGGGPVDRSLRVRAAAAGVRVVTTYGAAETAGGCVYDGLPLDGVGLAIGADGRVRISGPTLFEGYRDDPALTAETLVDGWFLTADAGRLDEDGRLQVLGRLDDVVLSGGVNVPTPAVAARLREHPQVAAAEVVGVPDEEWGQRVAAVVVGDLGLAAARDWVAAAHPRSWAPRSLHRVPQIPLLTNGKPDRLALRRLAAGQAERTVP